MTGFTNGSLFAQGHDDAFVAKLDGNDGALLWGVQFGAASDGGNDVAVAPDGTVYVTGNTDGELFPPRLGNRDVWVVRFDQDGTMIQGGQFGTRGNDYANKIAVAADGTAFVTGNHYNDLPNFFAKLPPVTAP